MSQEMGFLLHREPFMGLPRSRPFSAGPEANSQAASKPSVKKELPDPEAKPLKLPEQQTNMAGSLLDQLKAASVVRDEARKHFVVQGPNAKLYVKDEDRRGQKASCCKGCLCSSLFK